MTDILHIAYLPNGSFVLPIITRLKGSRDPKVRALAGKWQSSGLGRLGASLSTKVTMLGLIAGRLYSKLLPLQTELGQTPDLPDLMAGGYAWIPSQRSLPYEVLLELDSFIFEFRSAYEVFGKFLRAFSSEILSKAITETDLLKVLSDRGIDTAWAKELQERRKFQFHEHAPWLAYRVTNPEPLDADVVFLAHVDADPTKPEEAITTRVLSQIYSGFNKALQELQLWTLAEIAALEK